MENELEAFLTSTRALVDGRLAALSPRRGRRAEVVVRAIEAALLSPGKRIRPALVLAVGRMFGAKNEALLDTACAIEMIHASSLVFDDLPAMDNAALRRGLPTVHRGHGEAMAILAGVELLNRAFLVIGEEAERHQKYPLSSILGRLTEAVGIDGVVGGQGVDLTATPETTDLATLEYIHSHKTGALFIAAAEAGAVLAGARPARKRAVVDYAKNLGLAFQITDDLLDREDPATTGKDSHQDGANFVSFLGVTGARQLAGELTGFAEACLSPFGERASLLIELARHVRDRSR